MNIPGDSIARSTRPACVNRKPGLIDARAETVEGCSSRSGDCILAYANGPGDQE